MTLREIKFHLEALGAMPRKALGQNFLSDQNVARAIVRELEVKPENQVIEIGAGLGALTEYLVPLASRLTVIEKDGRLAAHLRERFAGGDVEIVHGDAIEFDLVRLLGRGRMRVIGNLPYYVSSAILDRFANPLLPVDRMVFTMQRELAERLEAPPRTKAYGAMTICLGRRWRIDAVRLLPPGVFYPAPKVESAVVVIEPRAHGEMLPCDGARFDALVRAGFSERRKQLRKLLPEAQERWGDLCEALGVPETVRAEELSIRQWEELTQILSPHEAQSGKEMFAVVDERDNVVGVAPRDEVHARNLRHRAVHVLLFNRAGELLLQKRSIWKDRNPGCWDSSVAGHVDAGESYVEAARREMIEEIGAVAEIEPVAKLGCGPETGWEFLQVFRGRFDGPCRFAPMEVEGGIFVPIAQVRAWLAARPGDFTPIFRQALPSVLGDTLR